jgi:L-aspartate oxidase
MATLQESLKSGQYDFMVIGSGLAGLAFALKASAHGRVCILSKTHLETGNTEMAQGGIAAVMSKDDSAEQHIRDTLVAGAGLCNKEIVKMVVDAGPDSIQDLVEWGVKFDRQADQSFSLTKEGGHSQRRILHVEDHTGLDIQRQLLSLVRSNSKIDLFENQFAIDLISKRKIDSTYVGADQCLGAYVLDRQSGAVQPVLSRTTVLATGGAGKAYLYTSNWSGATGDGVAMAHRLGARIANLEFMQFHPTCLYHPNARNFLISEALRGEGAELVNKKGEAFMKNVHPLGSLAPRDIVARSIDAEMKRTGEPCVFLDISHKEKDFIQTRFPQIYKKCLDYGIDITSQPIPVVPAAHYLCGGILTDANGRTDISGLYAIGENACTGLHGANRLASNSLLECLVFARSSSEHAVNLVRTQKQSDLSLSALPDYADYNQRLKPITLTQASNRSANAIDELDLISHLWDEIRRLMWAYVGIVRTNRRLLRAKNRLDNLLSEIDQYYSEFGVNSDIVELRNIAIFAQLTVDCAIERKESIGIHYNLDYPTSL